MTIRRKTAKKKSSKSRKPNPSWSFKSLFTRKGDKGDSINILVEDGNLILTGKNLPENYRTLFSILENDVKNLKVQFQPDGSSKKYTLNRPYDPKEGREKLKGILGSGDYGQLRRRPGSMDS